MNNQSSTEQKYLRLLCKVRQMRGVQKEYFKYRAKTDLDRARRLEREVDALIEAEIKAAKAEQNKLF